MNSSLRNHGNITLIIYENILKNVTVMSAIQFFINKPFQVYSSHHITRRHLVGMASVKLKDVENFDNGLIDLVIMPHTVYRVCKLL